MEIKGLRLREGEYLPDIGMQYPTDDPYARLVPAPKEIEMKFDETYPFLEDTLSFRIQRHLAYFIVFFILYFKNVFVYGIRFEGRDVLKKYRKQFRSGIVSVSNHCYRIDGAAIAQALGHRLWVPMLPDHFLGPERWPLKYFGGIPLPDPSFGAQRKFNEAFDTHNARHEWIHVFPEARNWHFYKPLRPFMKGAFTMAYKYAAPVLPIGITFRPRTGIHKLFAASRIPLVTVRIGEPIFPDKTKPRRDEVERLLHQSAAAIRDLVGIVENPWPDTIE